MAKIERFEDIEAWKKGRELSAEIYRITSDGKFRRDFGLRDQLRRAAVSIMSNIAEGFERGGDRQFRQFLGFAKGSTGELRSQLYVALDGGFIDERAFDRFYTLATQITRMVNGLMAYLARPRRTNRRNFQS